MVDLTTLLDIYQKNYPQIKIDNNLVLLHKPVFLDKIDINDLKELGLEQKIVQRFNFNKNDVPRFPADCFMMAYNLFGPRNILEPIIDKCVIHEIGLENDKIHISFIEQFLYAFYTIIDDFKKPCSNTTLLHILSQVIYRKNILKEVLRSDIKIKDMVDKKIDLNNLADVNFGYISSVYKNEVEVLSNAKKEGIKYDSLSLIGAKEANMHYGPTKTTPELRIIN